MSTIKKVIANTSVVAAGRFTGKLLGFITTIILARYLGVELFGQYSIILAFIAIFLFLNDFGIAYYIVREISRSKEKTDTLMGNAISLKIIFSLFAILITNLAAIVVGYSPELTVLISIFSFSLLSGSLSSLFSVVFQANLKMYYNVIVESLQNVLLLVVVLFFVITNGSLFEIMAFYTASTFVVMLAGYIFAKKFASFKPRFNFSLWNVLIISSWPFALNLVFTAIYTRIDVLLLSKLVGEAAVGIYSAAFRFTEALAFIPLALLISLYPLMSKYFKDSKELLKKTTSIALKFIVILFVPILIGTFLLAQRILNVVYGEEFLLQSGVQSLQVLTFASLFLFLNYLNINVLNSINLEKSVLKIIFIGIIINVVLNLLLIPFFGIVGAALATLIAEIAIFVIFYFVIKKHFFKLDLLVFTKPVVSSILMAVFVELFYSLNLFVLIAVSGIIYFLILFLIKGFSKEDIELLKKVFSIFSK